MAGVGSPRWSRAGAPWLKAGPICCSPFPLGVPQYSLHDPVSPTRSSNRTCGSPASGSRTGFTPRHSRVPTDDAPAVSLARRPCGIPSWPWRRASSAGSGFSGVFRPMANHPSSSASKAPRTRAPSLHRHYPASSVLRAPPPPACTQRPFAFAGPADGPHRRASRVARCSVLTCHHPPPRRSGANSSSKQNMFAPCQPSPSPGRVGLRIVPFGAASVFTHVTAYQLADGLKPPCVSQASTISLPPWPLG